MFVRILEKKSKTGISKYAYLVENNLVDGKIKQSVVLYFGLVQDDQIPFLKAAYAKKKPRLVYDD